MERPKSSLPPWRSAQRARLYTQKDVQTTAIASGNFSSSPSTPRKQKKACYTRSSPSSTRPTRALDSPLVVLYTGRRAVAQRLQREREREPTRERFAMCLPFGKRTSRPLLTRRAHTVLACVRVRARVCTARGCAFPLGIFASATAATAAVEFERYARLCAFQVRFSRAVDLQVAF